MKTAPYIWTFLTRITDMLFFFYSDQDTCGTWTSAAGWQEEVECRYVSVGPAVLRVANRDRGVYLGWCGEAVITGLIENMEWLFLCCHHWQVGSAIPFSLSAQVLLSPSSTQCIPELVQDKEQLVEEYWENTEVWGGGGDKHPG